MWQIEDIIRAYGCSLPVIKKNYVCLLYTSSRAVYHPRVVSANLYALVQPVENNIVAKLGARGCHSMIQLRKIGKLGSKRLAYGLMTQTYAQHRLATCILADNIHQQSLSLIHI